MCLLVKVLRASEFKYFLLFKCVVFDHVAAAKHDKKQQADFRNFVFDN